MNPKVRIIEDDKLPNGYVLEMASFGILRLCKYCILKRNFKIIKEFDITEIIYTTEEFEKILDSCKKLISITTLYVSKNALPILEILPTDL